MTPSNQPSTRPPGPALGWPLAPLVLAYVHHGRAESHLHEALHTHVGRLAVRYPDAYFELGRRTPEAVASLADQVYCTCAVTTLGRYPFHGRSPFRAYAEDRMEDASIRGHTFHFRLSVTRERLRDQYDYNLRRDPMLYQRDKLYRELGPILATHARRLAGSPERWTALDLHPRAVRRREDVVQALRELTDAIPLEALVPRALELCGAPITRSDLTNLLADARRLGRQVEPDPLDDRDHGQIADLSTLSAASRSAASPSANPDQRSVRAAILHAWQGLEEPDRALLAALTRGDETPEILAAHPQLRNKVQLSRAVDRVGLHFVRAVVEELGGEPAEAARPRELLEQVAAVLSLVLPELELRHGR